LLAPGTAVFRVPDELPDAVACPAGCATATAAAALRHAGDVGGAVVTILGAGLLGLTACAMAGAASARVVVADPLPERLDLATRFGATRAVPPAQLAEAVADLTDGRGADVAIDMSGAGGGPGLALDGVRVGGQCVWVGSVLPTPPVVVAPEAIVRRHLTIRGVHNYHPRDLAAALAFLAGAGWAYPFADLVGGPLPLGSAARETASAADPSTLRVCFAPDDALPVTGRPGTAPRRGR
jgi:alcohol dehydrogenase